MKCWLIRFVSLSSKGACLRIAGVGRLVEQSVDSGGDQLHVPNLLRRDRGDELIKGPKLLLRPHRSRLVQVVVERGHFAETAAHQLLDRGGGGGIELRRRQLDAKLVDTQKHSNSP